MAVYSLPTPSWVWSWLKVTKFIDVMLGEKCPLVRVWKPAVRRFKSWEALSRELGPLARGVNALGCAMVGKCAATVTCVTATGKACDIQDMQSFCLHLL